LPLEYGDPVNLEANLREKIRRAENLVDFALKEGNTCPLKILKRNFAQKGDINSCF
jgi:hypothetical protein